jgi:hypothetical protein
MVIVVKKIPARMGFFMDIYDLFYISLGTKDRST